MKKYNFLFYMVLASLASLLLVSCKKSDSLLIPPVVANFASVKSGTYLINSPTSVFKIPVGLTTVAAEERTITLSITSPTGAVANTHYTVSNKIVIPAGKVLDSLVVQGVYSQYLAGRKDTLVFTIIQDAVTAPDIYTTFTLFMRGPCSPADINTDLVSLLGTYSQTNELFGAAPYGPYTTTISSVTRTGPTTADIVVTNIYDDNPDWSPLTFTLDWSDLANTKITLLPQVSGGNAGNTFGATYNGLPHAVRPVAAAQGSLIGSFDFCTQKLTLRMQVGISGVGFSASIYTVVMQR
jgi:hypothetical protein